MGLECLPRYTNWINKSDWFSQHPEVHCDRREFLQGFSLEESSARGQRRYKYTCCGLRLTQPPWWIVKWSKDLTSYIDSTQGIGFILSLKPSTKILPGVYKWLSLKDNNFRVIQSFQNIFSKIKNISCDPISLVVNNEYWRELFGITKTFTNRDINLSLQGYWLTQLCNMLTKTCFKQNIGV